MKGGGGGGSRTLSSGTDVATLHAMCICKSYRILLYVLALAPGSQVIYHNLQSLSLSLSLCPFVLFILFFVLRTCVCMCVLSTVRPKDETIKLQTVIISYTRENSISIITVIPKLVSANKTDKREEKAKAENKIEDDGSGGKRRREKIGKLFYSTVYTVQSTCHAVHIDFVFVFVSDRSEKCVHDQIRWFLSRAPACVCVCVSLMMIVVDMYNVFIFSIDLSIMYLLFLFCSLFFRRSLFNF